MILPGAPRRVAITGVGVVGTPFTGGWAALGAALGDPHTRREGLAPGALDSALDGLDTRRPRASVSSWRRPPGPARCRSRPDAPRVVVGTELGDLRSTRDSSTATGARPAGLGAALPGTVMNTMAAATSIALQARAVADHQRPGPRRAGGGASHRAIAADARGLLAGGGFASILRPTPRGMGWTRGRGKGGVPDARAPDDVRPRARAGRSSVATALPARPLGWRTTRSRVVGPLPASGWSGAGSRVYAGGGDPATPGSERCGGGAGAASPPLAALGRVWAQHAGLGALGVAAAAWTARSGLLPAMAGADPTAAGPRAGLSRVSPGLGLVHGVARGGGQAAIVVGPAPAR
jgi:hypothetical protein